MGTTDSTRVQEAVSVAEALGLAGEAVTGLGPLWVEGEVFEYKGPWQGSGHYYFKLRDNAAVMDVKIWARHANRVLRCELEEGRKVRVRGVFDIYAARGSLSFTLDRVEDQGEGDLARQFQALKRRLLAEGLFDAENKKPLPRWPRTIGVLTSYPSAAWEDVFSTFRDKKVPLRVLVRGCRVQGEGAAEELAKGLKELVSVKPDLILLTRGGGSLKDLWAFNEEVLVRAVASCSIPTLSAIGHETDTVLTDFAADDFSRTPTASAVRICLGWEEGRTAVGMLGDRLRTAARGNIEAGLVRLGKLARDVRAHSPSRRLERLSSRVLQAEGRLLGVSSQKSLWVRKNLVRASRRLHSSSFCQALPLLRENLAGLEARLGSASPQALLSRGYALVEADEIAGYLRDPSEVDVGQGLTLTLSRGSLRARVE